MAQRNDTQMAEAIYSEVFGHLDDKRFRATKTTEIADWLHEGDLTGDETVQSLADEWREYDANDVAANPA